VVHHKTIAWCFGWVSVSVVASIIVGIHPGVWWFVVHSSLAELIVRAALVWGDERWESAACNWLFDHNDNEQWWQGWCESRWWERDLESRWREGWSSIKLRNSVEGIRQWKTRQLLWVGG